MSDVSLKLARASKPEPPAKPKLSAQERNALKKLRREAKRAGATLATDGEGGLPPSLVLGVMRRDGWHCLRCGKQTDLSLHHKAHLENPGSAWLRKKAEITGPERNNPSLLATICEPCHDAIHAEDRARS